MRRRGRREEFNPFARDASEQHRRRREERTRLTQTRITQNLNHAPELETTARIKTRKRTKPHFHKQLKSPKSPEISIKRDSFLEAQTQKTRDFVKDLETLPQSKQT